MKTFIVTMLGIMVCGLSTNAAEEAKVKNLLTDKWHIYSGSKTTTIEKDGVVVCENKGDTKQDVSGVNQTITLNQQEAAPITFSAESKCENVTGNESPTYAIYLDITHTDGSRTYGRVAMFKTGTHDWEKAEATYKPEKPIKAVSFHLLFRWRPGKAWFRNAVLTQGK